MSQPQKLPYGPMIELVEGGRLKRADILVTRSKGSLLGWLIRFGTGSYWNHAALVYVIKDPQQGYDTTFIIESGGGGIDIHNIEHYFRNTKKFDIGIKRLEKDWFQSDAEGISYRKRVRGFALHEIDDKYDYRMIIGIGRKIARQIILAAIFPWLRLKEPARRRAHIPKIVKKLKVNAYICSGFVQWAYYRAVLKMMEETEDSDKTKIQEVIFNPEIEYDVASEDILLSTTPADLANSSKLSWKYVVKGGVVWEIGDGDDDVDLILGKRSKQGR